MRQVITTDFQPLDRCILTEHSALLKKKTNSAAVSAPEKLNAAVAEAMRILEQSESGQLTDDEMRARFKAL